LRIIKIYTSCEYLLKAVSDNTPNLIHRTKVVRSFLVQTAYNNLSRKPIPNEGLTTNRFHNYIYWTNSWDIPESKIKPLFPENIDLIYQSS
jgi:hypothetical protein